MGAMQAEHTPKYLIAALGIVLAGLLGFIVASCGSGEGAEAVGPVPSASVPEGTVETPTTADEEPGSDTETGSGTEHSSNFVELEVWYTSGESLYLTRFRQRSTERVGAAAVSALLTDPELEGLGSAIPRETTFLGLRIEDGIAHVDLSSEFESGGGSLSMRMRVAQVVYTLTQFPTVKGVLFELDGEPVEVIGGEGVVIDHPLTRKDYADLLPAILVEQPGFGQRVANPVRVSGSANVFEANVTVIVLDEAGNELARTFTTATCGTGCRGTFSVSVPYKVAEEQEGTILVQDDDAAGVGAPPHRVRIPVLLSP
jgi:germination protein M